MKKKKCLIVYMTTLFLLLFAFTFLQKVVATSNLHVNGDDSCCETKQYIQSPQYSFVAAQFTSLDGSISPESNSFSGGFTGYVSSGSACGSTQYAKKLMFYADVRNSQFEPLASWFRVYYE